MDRDMGRMYYTISIRAPTRGATSRFRVKASRGIISIRAPTRGATIVFVAVCYSILFQSALPRGERHVPLDRQTPGLRISIRAPTRGATIELIDGFLRPEISIRAPTRGATDLRDSYNCSAIYFNPRSHEGSDLSQR